MKRIPLVLAGLALALTLAACGLIPAQPVDDPLGIDGQEVDVVFGGGALLASQTVQGTATASFQFSNGATTGIPINPATVTAPAGFEAEATLDSASGPATITLSDPEITVRIWEGTSTYADAAAEDRLEVSASFGGGLDLTQTSCSASAGTCSYEFDSEASGIMLLSLSGADLSTFLSISTEGPTTNYGEVEVAVGGDPDSLAGSTLTLTVDGAQGEVSF